MWGYYVALALRSSGRSKALTALVIVLLAFGVSACMVSYAVFRATTSDPLPAKSSRLYVPQVDNFGPSHTWQNEPPYTLSYTDAMVLWQAHKASRQTLLYPAIWQMESDDGSTPAMSLGGDAVTADFFAMFDVPFRFGSGWAANDDEQRATVVVISRRLNDKLFGGQNSVGKAIRLDGHVFRIAGVLEDWNPKPRFFDLGTFFNKAFDDAGDIYIPFTRGIAMQKDSTTYNGCPTESGVYDTSRWDARLTSECAWIDAWVELATPAEVARYREFLNNYAGQQQRLGRFSWGPNVRLRNLMDWMAYMEITPRASSLSMLISASFLLIVLVNVVGLMLAQFMRRTPEIGIRRALGASRSAIYRQFLIEGATMGFVGGLVGVALTLLGLWGAGGLFEPKIARLVHVDASLIALTVLLAVVATVVSALYPTWRAAQTQPAWQIKINS
ncbi:ABC transporter ATP-binding protein [Rhodanobacter panaciterrae]|uniref:ABC transporter ATP-binding protein n=1 Tax=Rhodanobacter panaciterrae TaxID=490572 RepID=A0ABQ2ZQK1_9GAMM|nr:ABC transporter permease [Rhodanobacter panaciterrae]GGY22378.1 ABC transporter ATP-binding protein [Rhodanobacter panaciterrae]